MIRTKYDKNHDFLKETGCLRSLENMKMARIGFELVERKILKDGRNFLRMSQRGFGKKLDVTHSAIGRVERYEPCNDEQYIIHGMYLTIIENITARDWETQEYLHAAQNELFRMNDVLRGIEDMSDKTIAIIYGDSVEHLLAAAPIFDVLNPFLREVETTKNEIKKIRNRLKRLITRVNSSQLIANLEIEKAA